MGTSEKKAEDTLARTAPVAAFGNSLTLYQVTFTTWGIAQSAAGETLLQGERGEWRYHGSLTVGVTDKGGSWVCVTSPVEE